MEDWTKEELQNMKYFESHIDFIWQRKFDIKDHKYMTQEQSEFNTLDKEVLYYIMKKDYGIKC